MYRCMIDSTAPIIPGKSAAGLTLGLDINEVLDAAPFRFNVESLPDGPVIYRSEMVDLWVKENKIVQIMVHGPYQGKLRNQIGLGSFLEDVKNRIGPVELDDEDNLVIQELKGLSLEVNPDSPNSEVEEIYVFE